MGQRIAKTTAFPAKITDCRWSRHTLMGQFSHAAARLSILQQGQEKTVTLTLGTLPNEKAASTKESPQQVTPEETPKLGLTLAPSSEAAGAQAKGVVVTAVDPNGVAADHGFRVGDVILEVGGKAVSAPADVQKQLADARKEGKRALLFRMKSGEGTRFVALPIGNA
jgi:serine protease Do